MEEATVISARPTFWNIPVWAQISQYILGFLALAIFIYGLWKHFSRWRSGRSDPLQLDLLERIKSLVKYALFQSRLSTEPRALLMHLGIFWGMVLLACGTALATVDWEITRLFLGFQILVSHFYFWFELVLDVAGLALIIGLLIAIYRRYILHLEKLKTIYPPTFPLDSFYLVIILLGIAVTGFFVEAFRLAVHDPRWQESGPYAFIGFGISKIFNSMPENSIRNLHFIFWCIHALLAFTFIASIPFSKAFHMVASGLSIFLRKFDRPGTLYSDGDGVQRIADFTWRQLIQFDGCTWCGRCQDVCPAYGSGEPLSPKNVILKLNKQLNTKKSKDGSFSLHGSIVTADELWACTTCVACETVCPVFIEQPRAITDMRRYLVSQGEVEERIQETLMNFQRYGNSFGQSERNRARWTLTLPFKIKDARKEPVEYLWFVGDYASYDARVQEITRIVATLFNMAGVDFGILYEGERNSGNDVRRIGEEGLFEMLVEKNKGVLEKAKFDKIVTTDPHTYNSLKNEYPKYGVSSPVLHYSELLLELIKANKFYLEPIRKKVTYHDPCYLGRYNGIYEEPREILRALGYDLIEMPRNRQYSHCCGAGGGRIWMEDKPGIKERPSENRIQEAVSLAGVEIFVTACPKDIVMFQDALKTTKNENKIVVKDLAELIFESIKHQNQQGG